MLEYAYDLSGTTFPLIKSFDIADGTAVKAGQAVKLDANHYVILNAATGAGIGVAAESKEANDGKLKIRVYCSPTAVFRVKPTSVTVTTATSATQFTSTDIATTTASAFIGGKAKVKTGANIVDGTVKRISANTAVGAFTVEDFGAATALNDEILLFPPVTDSFGVVNATSDGIDYNVSAGNDTKTIEVDEYLEAIYVQLPSVL